MRKIYLCVLIIILILSMCACAVDTTVKGTALVSAEGVTMITVSSIPENDTYNRIYTDSQKISKITEYIDSLTLDTDFSENPNEYTGMTWVITYVYEDGTQITMYHFGNMFFMVNGGKWHHMPHEEAVVFGSLISEHPSD